MAAKRARPITVRDLSRRYLDQCAKINKRSGQTDVYRMRALLVAFGEALVTNLQPEAIERYKTMRRDDGGSLPPPSIGT